MCVLNLCTIYKNAKAQNHLFDMHFQLAIVQLTGPLPGPE